MARLHPLVCAGCLAACALVATGSRETHRASGWEVRSIQRASQGLLRWLAGAPFVAALLRLSSWRMASDEVSRRVRATGTHLGREEACGALVAAGAVLSVLLALFARSPAGLVVGAAALFAGVPVWGSSRRRARERALVDEMPEVFRTLAMALGSGETLTQAIEYVGMHERGYAGQAFVNAALRLRCGASTEESMAELGRELEAPGVGLLTTALVIAQRTGSPLRALFQSSARLVERQGEYERMLAVKTAQVRLSVRIVCLLPVVLVCLLSLISVDFQQGVGTPAGMGCVLVAALMDGGALLIIRRMMRGVL